MGVELASAPVVTDGKPGACATAAGLVGRQPGTVGHAALGCGAAPDRKECQLGRRTCPQEAGGRRRPAGYWGQNAGVAACLRRNSRRGKSSPHPPCECGKVFRGQSLDCLHRGGKLSAHNRRLRLVARSCLRRLHRWGNSTSLESVACSRSALTGSPARVAFSSATWLLSRPSPLASAFASSGRAAIRSERRASASLIPILRAAALRPPFGRPETFLSSPPEASSASPDACGSSSISLIHAAMCSDRSNAVSSV